MVDNELTDEELELETLEVEGEIVEAELGVSTKWTAAELERSRKMMERKYSLGGK